MREYSPILFFIFNGGTLFEPDWSDWRAGVSLAKIIIDKLHQMNAIEALSQAQVDANGMCRCYWDQEETRSLLYKKTCFPKYYQIAYPVNPPSVFVDYLNQPESELRFVWEWQGTSSI